MSQTPSILGQNIPPSDIDTTLFVVPAGKQVQFSIFVANQAIDPDRITIALVPGPPTSIETSSNFIAYQTPLLGNAVIAFAGLFLNSGDRVQITSLNGTSSFTATGIVTAP